MPTVGYSNLWGKMNFPLRKSRGIFKARDTVYIICYKKNNFEREFQSAWIQCGESKVKSKCPDGHDRCNLFRPSKIQKSQFCLYFEGLFSPLRPNCWWVPLSFLQALSPRIRLILLYARFRMHGASPPYSLCYVV